MVSERKPFIARYSFVEIDVNGYESYSYDRIKEGMDVLEKWLKDL